MAEGGRRERSAREKAEEKGAEPGGDGMGEKVCGG